MSNSRKVISVLMALILSCSVFLIPASAIDSAGDSGAGLTSIKYSVKKHIGKDTNGADATDIYALTVAFKTDNPVNGLLASIYYDSTKFAPVDGSDMTIMDWGFTTDHSTGLYGVAYGALDEMGDMTKYNEGPCASADRVKNPRGPISGLGKSTLDSEIFNDCTWNDTTLRHFWGKVPQSQYGVIYFQLNQGDKTCNIQVTPDYVPFVELYFKLKPGITEDMAKDAKFGYLQEGKNNDGSVERDVKKFYFDKNSTALTPAFTANFCTIAGDAPVAAGPAVASHKSEIRFNGVKPTPTSFDYRITSKILQADWDKYFAGTKTGAATNAITKVGAVAFDPVKGGTFDLAQAKAVAKAGASAGSYGYGSTTYIQKTATDAFFGCIIPGLTHTANNQDMQVLGFVEYKDATGAIQYIFYDAAATAAVNSKYDTALALWSK